MRAKDKTEDDQLEKKAGVEQLGIKAVTLENEMKRGSVVAAAGIVFFILEILKQLGLWLVEYHGSYNVWYFPFQVCSMPIYLGLWYGLLYYRRGEEIKEKPGSDDKTFKLRQVLLTFLCDYGMLVGALALIVHDGLIHPGYPLLTLHGFVWHILMVLLSIYIFATGLSDLSLKGYFLTVPLFLGLAAIAELINIILHPYGDCDMFYISPYHVSSQIVFCDIDRSIGRIPGIFVYLFAVMLGAFIVHFFTLLFKKMHSTK